MEKIRIARNVKRIEVNDKGEFIELDFDDQSLPYRFMETMKDIYAKKQEFDRKIAADDGKNININSIIELEYEVNLYFKARIDILFGEGTCRKVYGDILPSVDMHIELLNQLLPYFEEYTKKRREKMSRYDAGRTGNV